MGLPFGTAIPRFIAPSPVNPRFEVAALGGRYVFLIFLPEPSPARDAALAACRERIAIFRDDNAVLFGVLPDEASFARAANAPNGMRWLFDPDGRIRRLYGAAEADGAVRPEWFLIDPTLRVIRCGPLATAADGLQALGALGAAQDHAGVPVSAPVLVAPRILEPEFCQALIAAYEADGGQPSGVMRTIDGQMVRVFDGAKKRRDADIPAGPLVDGLRARLVARLIPEIKKAFQFDATRIERFIVACYDAEEGGYFRPHIDNGAPETAHRKFAVTINLNDAFDGGELRFPEFGPRTYRAPLGGAVVFSTSLLHEATAVTRGRRYATLPFLYDEAAAKIRVAFRGDEAAAS